jgi:hypothetical protein
MFGLILLLFSWLYNNANVDCKADQTSIKAQLKSLGKTCKNESKSSDQSQAAYVYNRWTTFGGVFYDLAALWTFLVVEIS